MAKKKSQLDKAIESLEAERAILDAAIARLRQQQTQAPANKQRVTRPAALPKEAAS